MISFASDNYAGVWPEAIAAIGAANAEHTPSYGGDPWTARAQELVRHAFGEHAEAHLVFNGTAANVLCLEALCKPWEAVITTRTSHLHVDECGAPEALGIKLLLADTPDGKLRPEDLGPLVVRVGDEHAVQARVVSLANSTELGTVYTVDELRAIGEACREHGLLLHVDGARLPNAAAALGVSLRAITTDIGAAAVSLGGTKVGLLGVEAAVLLDPRAAEGFAFRRKRRGQLASKMRYASAQLALMLEDERWRTHAAHANAMAHRLMLAVRDVPGVRLTQPVEANALFAILPPGVAEELQRDWRFYTWDEATGEVRWMCAWDTPPEAVDAFAEAIGTACAAAAAHHR